MTEKILLRLGFKKIKEEEFFWFEYNYRNHRFITSDNSFNKTKFIIGYENTRMSNVETFWFNNNLKLEQQFKSVFNIIVGKKFNI